jgi:hypothetical protein
MAKQADGFWTATTATLVLGFHYYTLFIDGADVSNSNIHTFFGGGRDASGIDVPEKGSTYYLPQDVPHGRVCEIWYDSNATGIWRHALVYTPPGYDTDINTKYPVLYLRHGASGQFVLAGQKFDPQTAYHGDFADPAAFAKRVHLLWLGVGTAEPDRFLTGLRSFN